MDPKIRFQLFWILTLPAQIWMRLVAALLVLDVGYQEELNDDDERLDKAT
jgi:hypothetical protein